VTNGQPAASSAAQPESQPSAPPKKAVAAKAVSPAGQDPDPLEHRIRDYIESKRLIRINVNKGLGVKLSIPCRVLNYDSATQLITVYHVDEKQVYTVRLTEIDDFVE